MSPSPAPSLTAEAPRPRTAPPVRPGRPVSALYEGWVGHRRLGPPDHAFRVRSTMVLLDLDELEQVLDATPLWSARHWAPVRFRRRDHLDGTDQPLREALADLVEARTGRRPHGGMRLLTQLRRFGWLFNPISIYWCDGVGDEPDVVVLEVTNTPWHERHWYVLEADGGAGSEVAFAKDLHVSPFLPMDLTYRLAQTGSRGGPDDLGVHLDARAGERLVFEADLALRRIELTPAHAVASVARHPLATVAVSAAIHRQAVALWAKRVPIHRHPRRTSP